MNMAKKSDFLREALNRAKTGLGVAVRALIHNGIHDGTPERNQLENSFEAAKNALVNGPAAEHLHKAIADLKLAVNILSNHSLKNAADLTAVREALAATARAEDTLLKMAADPETTPVPNGKTQPKAPVKKPGAPELTPEQVKELTPEVKSPELTSPLAGENTPETIAPKSPAPEQTAQ